ncbi:MAG: aspartate/glutamate racemase family protein, partial [Clostridiales bacterium]|nr:aspartate/glutamate racemase family protein [Clostridiales bacterium]
MSTGNGINDRPIGVFDSGIGGLTVLREIWNVLPNESTVYFGDNGRYPYGTKSHDTIVQYSLQNMRFLLSQNVKMIVIACSSAGAHAQDQVRRLAGVPVVEVITPGAEQAVKETRNGKIGVIAT